MDAMIDGPQQQAAPTPTLAYEPTPGDLFAGRYLVESLLGRGATGAVWAARDEEVGDRVALKLLVAGPEDAEERFRREVRLARRVTHRNAARIFDLGTENDVLFLTMELIEGESLQQMVRRESPLEVAQATEIGRQIAQGLSAAHEVDVIHRDIKPANVLLESTGRVVLTDFGVARAVASEAQMTIGAAMIGSPSYMAPEQVRGETIGPATDLYALGAVLYEMLTAKCPFVGDSVVATAVARLESDPRDPRELTNLPDDVAELILGLLARNVEDRPGSALQVAAALAEMTTRSTAGEADATLYGGPTVRSGPGATTTQGIDASSTFVSIAPEQRTIAVLPFRHRGDAEYADLAEDLAEDLVDILTTTRGLRVTATGATLKYQGQAVDPREAGAELGVDAIVAGTSRVQGERLKISARLIDVATGEQLWVDRFEGELANAFEIQEGTAQRIAEDLRQELELLSARHSVPAEAVELLLAARQRATIISTGTDDDNLVVALDILEKALEIAPNFALAIATHAEYSVRRWFLPSRGGDEAVSRRAHDSVDRALLKAPDLAATHFAAGRLAVSDGRFGDAASELVLSLKMAPTYAAVHVYLGMLQCEAGRGDEGERHIRLARTIDPTLPMDGSLARRAALAGDFETYERMVLELKATPLASRFMIDSLEMRVAGWRGDLETVRRCRPSSFVPPDSEFRMFMDAQQAGLLGEGSVDELKKHLAVVLDDAGAGPRLSAFIHQLAIEALMPLGDHDGAMAELAIAVDYPVFVDTEWMDQCTVLDPLRDRPEFAALQAQVRRRADAIWRVSAA